MKILDIYTSYGALTSAHPTGEPGDMYLVGTAPENYTVYAWQASVGAGVWRNIGPLTSTNPYDSEPAASNGPIGAAGSSQNYARGDHKHPSDATKVDQTQYATSSSAGIAMVDGTTITALNHVLKAHNQYMYGGMSEGPLALQADTITQVRLTRTGGNIVATDDGGLVIPESGTYMIAANLWMEGSIGASGMHIFVRVSPAGDTIHQGFANAYGLGSAFTTGTTMNPVNMSPICIYLARDSIVYLGAAVTDATGNYADIPFDASASSYLPTSSLFIMKID